MQSSQELDESKISDAKRQVYEQQLRKYNNILNALGNYLKHVQEAKNDKEIINLTLSLKGYLGVSLKSVDVKLSTFHALRKCFNNVLNTLDGLERLFDDDDLKNKANVFTQALASIEMARKNASNLPSSIREKLEISDNPEQRELLVLSIYKKNYPSRITSGEFDIIRMPVVPMLKFAKVMTRKAVMTSLEKAFGKFNVVQSDGFWIVTNQIILVVNAGYDPKEALSVLTQVMGNNNNRVNYDFMSEKHHVSPVNQKLNLYWIVPKLIQEKLGQSSIHPTVQNWSFPWEDIGSLISEVGMDDD